MTTPIVPCGRYGRTTYHTDRDCRHLSASTVRPATDAELDELELCSACGGDRDTGGAGSGHIESLRAAADAGSEGSV